MCKQNLRRASFSVLVFFSFILNSTTASCQNSISKEFKAGAASVSITPNDNSKLLAGRKIHDTLYAKSLILDDGAQKMVFVIADNQGIPAFVCDITRDKIHELTNIPVSNILISATHTHTGITANPAPINLNKDGSLTEYQEIISTKIVESVLKAMDNLEPARIGWSNFEKPEYVFNRRWYVKSSAKNPFGLNDSVKMNPGFASTDLLQPAGPTDPEISFFAVESIDGSPIAVLANYSIHYIGGAAPRTISADYYGEFGNQLAGILETNDNSNPFVGIMTNGTSGDVSHNDYRKQKPKQQPFEEIRAVAKDLAETVASHYRKMEFHDWVPLKIHQSDIKLSFRRPTEEVSTSIQKITQQRSAANIKSETEPQAYARRVNDLVTRYPANTTFPIQTFLIGDLAIASIPFEVFAETGLELKSRSPFKNTFTIGLANGHWGYLPTPSQHKKGGYETWISVSRVQEDASQIIVEQALKQLDDLKNQ